MYRALPKRRDDGRDEPGGRLLLRRDGDAPPFLNDLGAPPARRVLARLGIRPPARSRTRRIGRHRARTRSGAVLLRHRVRRWTRSVTDPRALLQPREHDEPLQGPGDSKGRAQLRGRGDADPPPAARTTVLRSCAVLASGKG